MIRVERPKLTSPEALDLLNRAGAARQALIDAFQARQRPAVGALYRDFKSYLLAAFHDKCAYCEIMITEGQPGDVEHYRPKNRVTDQNLRPVKIQYPDWGTFDHMGYFWLAYDWKNLLPSCADCNRYRQHDETYAGKLDRFPVSGFRAFLPDTEGDENPLLIDPTQVEPDKHLEFFPDGTMRGRTPEGAETIALLGLNIREKLVRARRDAYAGARRGLKEWIDEVPRGDLARIADLRREVNEIWSGATPHTAFARLSLNAIQLSYKAMGADIPLPLPEMR